MAKKKVGNKFAAVHKLSTGIWLLAFFVIVVTGFQAGASVSTVLLKASVVSIVILLIHVIVVSIFKTSEEMNGG